MIPKIGEAAETISLDGLCRDYEQSCSSCITVQDTQIYLLHNLTRSGKEPEEIEQELTAVNQKYHCNAGISTFFSDFFACRSYFDQAQAAYETGHAIDETKSLYNFAAYREGKSKYLASDIVLQGVIDADVIYAEKTPFLYDYVPGYPSLLYNIFMEGQYMAQICVDAVCRPFRDSDYSKIYLLGRYIKTCIIHMPNHGRIMSNRLQRSFYLYFCEGIAQFQQLLFAMQRDLTDCDENLCYAMLLERKFYNDSNCFFYKIRPPFSPDI